MGHVGRGPKIRAGTRPWGWQLDSSWWLQAEPFPCSGGGALRCGGFTSDRGEQLETLNVVSVGSSGEKVLAE